MGVSVREKEKGSGVWWVFISYKGKRKSKKIGKDRRLAEEIAKKINARLQLGDMGILSEEDSILFGDYAITWLEGYVRTALKKSTYEGYKSILFHHLIPEFGKEKLERITREDVKNFLFKKIKWYDPGACKAYQGMYERNFHTCD